MDNWLRRNFWVVIVTIGSLTVYFTAIAITQLLAAKFLPLNMASVQGLPRAHSTSAPNDILKRIISAKTILERNSFDSITGPILDRPMPASEVPIQTEATDPQEMLFSPCSGNTKLAITMVDPIERARSFAVVGPVDRKKSLVREGSPVDNRQIAVIVRERVYLRESQTYCYIAMFEYHKPEIPKTSPANTPLVDPSSIHGGAPRIPAEIEKGIQKISDTNFNIDRTTVDKIIENQAELMRSARIVPEQENGKTVGIKLLNIRSDTLLGKLGMLQGDTLKSLNGFDMTSPEKALEAYAKIRTAPQIVVSVIRNGKPVNLEYNIK